MLPFLTWLLLVRLSFYFILVPMAIDYFFLLFLRHSLYACLYLICHCLCVNGQAAFVVLLIFVLSCVYCYFVCLFVFPLSGKLFRWNNALQGGRKKKDIDVSFNQSNEKVKGLAPIFLGHADENVQFGFLDCLFDSYEYLHEFSFSFLRE